MGLIVGLLFLVNNSDDVTLILSRFKLSSDDEWIFVKTRASSFGISVV